MDKVLNFIEINESQDSFGAEMSSSTRIKTRKLKESICIINICPIKWITPLTPMDTNNLPPYGQSVEFY